MIQASERVDMTAHADGTIDIRTRHRSLPGITLALEGAHQRHNAAVAVALLEELSRGGFAAPDAAIRDALTHVRWPGRLEHFSVGGTPVLIDAAHNPAGATALAAYLEEHGWRDATLVFGAMADKDVRGMLEALLRPAHVWGGSSARPHPMRARWPHPPSPRSPWRSPGEAFRSRQSRILRLRSTEPWPRETRCRRRVHLSDRSPA